MAGAQPETSRSRFFLHGGLIMPPQKKKRFYVRDIDAKTWNQFRILAIRNDLTLNEAMNTLIRQAVEVAQEQEKNAGRKTK
jgi:hypothetical protein